MRPHRPHTLSEATSRAFSSARVLALVLSLSSLLGCGDGVITVGQTRVPSTGGRLAIHGRIVDLNSCLLPPCDPAVGLVVSAGPGRPRSAPSGVDGGFVIEGLSAGESAQLTVDDAPGESDLYVPTRMAEVVTMSNGEDVYGVMVYVVRRDSFFYQAIVDELGAAVESHALYLGQVFHTEDEHGTLMASKDVEVKSPAAASIRFRKAIDEHDQLEGFYLADHTTTGPTGQFLVVHPTDASPSLSVDDLARGMQAEITAPLKRGVLTIQSLHMTP